MGHLSIHADVNIQGVRVRISSCSGEDLAIALDVLREHITPMVLKAEPGWRHFQKAVPWMDEFGVLWTTKVPDLAVYDEAKRLWRMPASEDVAPDAGEERAYTRGMRGTVVIAKSLLTSMPDEPIVSAPEPTWREKPPLL